MTNFDVICVGDAIVDAFLQIHDANKKCRLSQDCELCIRYGDKITVDTCDFLLGGNACNVSVGLSRMGFKARLLAEIGDDEFAQKIKKGLIAEGVDTHRIIQTPGAVSSFAIGINFKKERTLFVAHATRDHHFAFDSISAKWVYLTSLGKEWKEAYKKTLAFVKNTHVALIFNPGTPQLEEIDELFIETLQQTYTLFVNKEEANQISNIKYQISKINPPTIVPIFNENDNNIKDLLKSLQKMGPKIVVITDGRNGSYAINEIGKMYSLGMFPGEPVERTGAGDGYTSGFLSAIILGLSVPEAMRFGTINAGSVVQHIGAQPGLLSKLEVEKKLAEHKEFEVKEI